MDNFNQDITINIDDTKTDVININDIEYTIDLQEPPKVDIILDSHNPEGQKGDTGNGISYIEKTSTSGLVDTYTIYFTDGNSTTFDVTNGDGIESIVKTSTVGLVDTYTITLTSGDTYTFTVTNGEQGERGASAVVISTTEPTDDDVKIWLNPAGTPNIPLFNLDGGNASSIYTSEQIINGGCA